MNTKQLLGIVRHVLSAAGGVGIAYGIGTEAQWMEITSAGLTLAAVIWSWWDKRS